jgi:transposase InsO family protein
MIPPPRKISPPTWSYLLESSKEIWSMDFANIIDIGRLQVYFLVVIDIKSRELIYLSITLCPNRTWLHQQFRNIAIEEASFPDFLIIDNDGIYGKWIDPIFLEQYDIKVLRTDKGCPWQNGVCERFIGTLKTELLYRIPINHNIGIFPHKFATNYNDYYNKVRPHQGIDGKTTQNSKKLAPVLDNFLEFKYKKVSHLHGLFTEFLAVG